MLKYFCFALIILLASSWEAKESSCSALPFISIPPGGPVNTDTVAGWYYDCQERTCLKQILPNHVNISQNFFASINNCRDTCPGIHY